MRYLPSLLAKLFPPQPLPSVSSMDTHTSEHRRGDPIARALDAAVSEHERTAAGVREDYDPRLQQLRSAIDELLEQMDQRRHDDSTS